ncbi:divergent polysaccharide deacetylase family protein [Photobacterium japonica]|uniref:divergent polysaccharide deacetylase family protein n=1 Tax=Photobacterium japonica TaxID=2910235 RepID=UPI003D143756
MTKTRWIARQLPFFLLVLLCVEVHAAKLAIVIDDLGYQAMPTALAQLPSAISVAILPDTPYAAQIHHAAKQQQRDILLHMPMEPSRPAPLEPSTLMRQMNKATLQATLHRALQQLPDAIAMNNHMGSALTQDTQATGWVMEVLAQQGLHFLDSRTTPRSIAHEQAAQHQVAVLYRHIFLDHERNATFIRQQLRRAMQQAKRHGVAIAIGHPYPITLETLQQWLPQLPHADITLVKLSALYPSRTLPSPVHTAPH